MKLRSSVATLATIAFCSTDAKNSASALSNFGKPELFSRFCLFSSFALSAERAFTSTIGM